MKRDLWWNIIMFIGIIISMVMREFAMGYFLITVLWLSLIYDEIKEIKILLKNKGDK